MMMMKMVMMVMMAGSKAGLNSQKKGSQQPPLAEAKRATQADITTKEEFRTQKTSFSWQQWMKALDDMWTKWKIRTELKIFRLGKFAAARKEERIASLNTFWTFEHFEHLNNLNIWRWKFWTQGCKFEQSLHSSPHVVGFYAAWDFLLVIYLRLRCWCIYAYLWVSTFLFICVLFCCSTGRRIAQVYVARNLARGWMWLQFGLWRNPALGLLRHNVTEVVTQCRNCGGSIGHQFATMSMSPNINTIHIHGRSEAWCIVMNCQYSAKFSMRLRQKSWQKAITSTHAVQAKRGGRAEWSKQASPNCSPIWVEQAG